MAAGLLGAAAPRALAVPPGEPGDIAFDSRRAGDWDVYVMDRSGNFERRLDGNASGAVDARPTWSPDPGVGAASGLVPNIGSSGDVVEVNFDVWVPLSRPIMPTRVWFGTLPAQPQYDPAQAKWVVTVPPGASSSFVCLETIPIIGINHLPSRTWFGTFTVMGPPQPGGAYCPSQPIAFQSDRTGDFDVWMVDPAPAAEGGGALIHLLDLPGSDETAPAWSPGPGSNFGSPWPEPLIAFESDRAGTRDIWVLDPSRPVSLGTNPSRLTSGPSADANPDWSVDAKSIAFERSYRGRKEIWALDVFSNGDSYAASNPRRITAGQPPSFEPTWFRSDEGGDQDDRFDQIVFSGPEPAGGCALGFVEQRHQNPTVPPGFVNPNFIEAFSFPDRLGREDSPAFSPMGDQVLYHSNETGNDDIWVQAGPVDEDTEPGAPARLTESFADDRHPSWQPLWMAADVSYRRVWGKRRRWKLPPERVVVAEPPSLAQSDCRPPNTRVTAGPLRLSSTKARFRFRATEASRFRCRLDLRPWVDCRSPKTFTITRAGRHTLRVRAIDRAGNMDLSPAVVRWRW